MQAGEQVGYFGRLHGLSRRKATSRAVRCWRSSTSATAGATAARSCPVARSSACRLATALVHAPEVIVLDEPFSGQLRGRRLRHHQRQREHTPC